MSPDQWLSVKELFHEATKLAPQARASFLRTRCHGDEEVLHELLLLLESHDEAEHFIEQPALAPALEILSAGGQDFWTGRRIGQYSALGEIGRGGMGIVLRAVRADDQFKKQVAIKVLQRGYATEDLLRRFRNERQILATLEHPNIARLLDGGMTADGLPYIVMEYIEGEPLDRYCDARGLSIAERLKLFRTACAAVQYAHQNLIIHRDLKPSNILVTAAGELKLLDFGIAKLLNPESANEKDAPTVTIARLLTPDYASPEQSRGGRVTTATDIYSLGVILYELLTGTRPYKLTSNLSEDLTREIRNSEPSRPSDALSRLLSAPPTGCERAVDRQSGAPRDPKALKGDLDNVVLMALRKEPERRYRSVEQFSEDIRRHLEGLPVLARRDTFRYRASKFVGRNRVAVSAAALVVLAVITGLIIALWQGETARRQRDLAQQERMKAERINTFLQRMLSFSNQSITSVSPVPQRRDVTVNEMLNQIAPQIEAELVDQPDVRAQVLRTIGSAYASQGQYEAAEKNLRAALDVQTRLYGEESTETVGTMFELGALASRQQKLHEANHLLEKAVTFYKNQRQAKSAEYSAAKLAQAMESLGTVKSLQGETKEGISLLNEALQIASDAKLPDHERQILASIKTDLGGFLVFSGDLQKGENLLRESLAEYDQISSQPRWERGATVVMLGIVAFNKNQLDEADKLLREGEQIYRRTLGNENGYVAFALNWQAAVLYRKGYLKDAEEKAREALTMYENINRDNRSSLAGPMLVLADILTKAGRAREGEDYYRRTLAIYEQPTKKNYLAIAQLKLHLSQSLLAQNRLTEAEQIALEARDEARQNLPEQSPLIKATMDNLIRIQQNAERRQNRLSKK